MQNLVEKALAYTPGVNIPGSTNITNYSTYMSAVLKYAVNVGFLLAFLMIIFSGIKYMLSQGNQSKIEDAKEMLIGAVIGFAMLLMINIILRVLGITTK